MYQSTPLIFVVVPTYNEIDNLACLVGALLTLPVRRLHVLIVDDNSPDGTGELAQEMRTRSNRLHVIHRPRQAGLGAAYRDGFRWALAHGADYVVQMDADLSHRPQIITQFLKQISGCDVVVGSRYVPGGSIDPLWSWWRRALSRWLNTIYLPLLLRFQVHDATTGFKCWSRRALATILQQDITSSGYSFQIEMAYLAERLGFRVRELPIHFEERCIGQSKLSWLARAHAIWRPWYLLWQYRRLQTAAHVSPSVPRTYGPQRLP